MGTSKVFKIFLFALLAGGFFTACAGPQNSVNKAGDAQALYLKGIASYEKGFYEEAEVAFKGVLEDYPLSPQAAVAQVALGDTCYAQERYEEAAAYYTTFCTFHPAHEKAPYALFQKGMSLLKEVLSIDRDQTSTKKALFAFEDIMKNYPESPYAAKAKELAGMLKRRLAENEFYVGKFYHKMKNYRGALLRFGAILESYPDAGMNDSVLYYIGDSYIRLGEKKLATDAFSTLVSEFPQSPYAAAAKAEL